MIRYLKSFIFSEVNSTDFMQKISDQTKMIQEGMKTLRSEMDNQMRMLDIGQEAVVLSGLNKHATNSLKNIKNLYDETKYLKSYLEKVKSSHKRPNENVNLSNFLSWSPAYFDFDRCSGINITSQKHFEIDVGMLVNRHHGR